LNFHDPFDLALVAKRTPGFVGADLMSLAKEAAMLAVERLSKAHGLLAPVALLGDALRANGLHFASSSSSSSGAMDESSIPGHVSAKEDQATAAPDAAAWAPAASTVVTSAVAAATTAPRPGHPHRVCGPLPVAALVDLLVTEADFLAATKLVQPTAKREGFAMAPDVSWDDIGALAGVRDELSLSVHTKREHTNMKAFPLLRNLSTNTHTQAKVHSVALCAPLQLALRHMRMTNRMDSPSRPGTSPLERTFIFIQSDA
jgi:ribosome biogenesis ATPase